MHQIKKLCLPEALDLSSKKSPIEAPVSGSTLAQTSEVTTSLPQPASSFSVALLQDSPGLAFNSLSHELSSLQDVNKPGNNNSAGSPSPRL